jgi:hypothetical protein
MMPAWWWWVLVVVVVAYNQVGSYFGGVKLLEGNFNGYFSTAV